MHFDEFLLWKLHHKYRIVADSHKFRLVKYIAPQFELPLVPLDKKPGKRFKRDASTLIPVPHYVIHTDGSVWPNPGGNYGWCAIIDLNGERAEIVVGRGKNGTNCIAEMCAAIGGLESTPIGAKVTIITDAQYITRGVKKWRTHKPKSKFDGVKNGELWYALMSLVSERTVDFKWVRGHADDPINCECDAWAEQQRLKVK